MKLLVSPNSIEDIEPLIDMNINSFLFGINHLSIYHNFYLNLEELKTVAQQHPRIEIFVSLNKLMHNYDLEILTVTMTTLSHMKIKGVLYDDVAILNLNQKLELNLNLIWASPHLITNYHTINALSSKIKGALISSEITLKDILKIRKNTTATLIAPVFGYQPMTTSKRTLITNYQNYVATHVIDNLYYLKDNNHYYPVVEDENGTHIYSANVLNGIKELTVLKKNNIDYLYLNSIILDHQVFNEVVHIFQSKLMNKPIAVSHLTKLVPNSDTMFFYQETYFKVGSHDKS